MSEVVRRHRVKSWVSQLHPRLKAIIIPRSKSKERHGGAAVEFRITHSPDRPARAVPADAAPTDEECVGYLLALRRHEKLGGGRGGRCGSTSTSTYKWSEIDGSSFLHRARVSGGETTSVVTGTTAVQSPESSVGEDPLGDEAGKASALGLAGDYCSSPGGDLIPRLYRHDNLGTTTVPIARFLPAGRIDDGGSFTPRSLTRRAQPDPDMGPSAAETTTTARGAKIPDRPQRSVPVFPRETESDSDGEDDAYGDWAEYYFDETNFRGRDEGRLYLESATTTTLF